MKKLMITFLIVFSLQDLKAQVVFCPPGAEWHYLFTETLLFFAQPYYNQKIEYVKDSLLGQDLVKVLQHRVYYAVTNFYVPATSFIKQKDDTVFMRSLATANTWQILYNYAAVAGQSWTTTINTSYNFGAKLTYTVTVDSVSSVIINNTPLKRLYVKYKKQGSSFEQSTYITERIGCQIFMFNYNSPNAGTDPHRSTGCICYSDSMFGLKQFTEKPCDYNNPTGITENKIYGNTVGIYPNPASDYLVIDDKNGDLPMDADLRVSDLIGREIVNVKMTLPLQPLDVSDINNGVYIISIRKDEKLLVAGKIVVQH